MLHPDASIVPARDFPKFIAEAHRRLTSPFTALNYTLVALVSVLMGGFRRHGGVLRPLAGIMTVVGLLALGLAVGNLAARDSALVPLMWLHAIVPGLICLWLLLGPVLLPRRAAPGIEPGPDVSAA